jgi:hypothetical protein
LFTIVHVDEIGFDTAVQLADDGFDTTDHAPVVGFARETQLAVVGFARFVHDETLEKTGVPDVVSAKSIPIGSPPPMKVVTVTRDGFGTFVHALIG